MIGLGGYLAKCIDIMVRQTPVDVGGYMDIGYTVNKLKVFKRMDCTHYILDDLYHRPNGPALWRDDGKWWSWFLFDREHRYYGPAHCNKEWWCYGMYVK